jgi:UDP-N-acetylmuramyl pentapeptide phosphotransferase/UDP-N-acetylglucosamine-1-phosphate transferase
MFFFLLLAAAVFLATLGLIRLLSKRRMATLVDLPNHRSLHDRPIPKVGGLAMLVVALASVFTTFTVALWPLWACAAFLLTVSVVDDARNLPALARLSLHSTTACALLWAYPTDGLLFNVLAFATFVWMANLYNFMDGADGLAGGMTVFGFGTMAFASYAAGFPELASFALILAVAASAFLCFNFPPASVFMGDAGAVPLGFLAAALGYLGFQQAVWPYWFPALVFSPFILDASYTLIKRALRGEKVWVAHREHVYQRLILAGWSHRRLALVAYGIMSAVDAAAIFALRQPVETQIVLIASVLFLQALLIVAAEAYLRKPPPKSAIAKAAKEAHR